MPHPPAPNFRVPKRLIAWMQANAVRERVVSAEHVFFKKNLDVGIRAISLANYARQASCRLPSEMEVVIAEYPAACVEYAGFLRKFLQVEVPEEIVDGCRLDQGWIVKMASVLGNRIPRLEHMIVRPETYVEYALAVKARVPEMEDRILFSEDDSDLPDRALWAFRLIERTIGPGFGPPKNPILEDRKLKDLIKQNSNVVMSFMEFLGRRGSKLPVEFHNVFAGDGERLFKLACHLRDRLPSELEMTWQGARSELVQYAVRYVRGPLPEGLEDVLIGDTKAICEYAFQVVRGFASPRLSDTLNNCMLIGEQTEDVKRYIAECDRVEAMKKLIEEGIKMAS